MRKSFITIGCAIVIYTLTITECHKNDSNVLKWISTFRAGGCNSNYSVQQTSDDGYIIAGSTELFGTGCSDVYLIKADANGDTIWTKTFGGTGYDYGHSVQQISDDGYIIVGYTYLSGIGYDVYLIKTDTSGNHVWTKTFSEANSNDEGNSVQQTSDGGYIIAGGTRTYGIGTDVYLIKTDANGNTE